MSSQTFTDSAYRTFTARVPADLVGKEFYLVEEHTDGTIQLLTTGLAVGVLYQCLEGGEDWTVRLLGKGGTVKVKAGGVIATPARVKGANGGKVVDLAGAGRSLGIKLSPTANSANNDVIEIYDVVEVVSAGDGITPQAAPVLGNANGEIAALTFTGGGATGPEVEALRDKCEELADDLRAIHAALLTAGVFTA